MRPPEHPPGYREGFYPMEYKCTNCGRSVIEQLPKGKPAPRKIKTPCPNCGCRTLERG